MNKNKIDQIQELDEEELVNSYIPKSSKDAKKFTFTSHQEKKGDDQDSGDSSHNLNIEQTLLSKNRKSSEDALLIKNQKPHMKTPIINQFNDEIIKEEFDAQENDFLLSGRDQYFKDNSKSFSKNYGEDRNKKAARPKVKFPQERMDAYEEIKNESNLLTFALSNAPRNKKPNTDNYKTLISDHMKLIEKEKVLSAEQEERKESATKMISTEIETQIRDHIINHKIRANQKYQVVKNFFRIWFINAKEIRRIEKKQSQKNSSNQMVADKILLEEQETRQRKRFINEKSLAITSGPSKKQVKKVKSTQVGQMYIKPGFDIKLFIPYCTDIYLGRD